MENPNNTKNMERELVFNENGAALTNSMLVAKKFGKKHKHVLEAIRKIMTAENSAVESMYFASTYLNEQNHKMPLYIMNRDGFSLLAMGFTGKEAIKFKVDYINAFNKMEAILKERQTGAVIMHQPSTNAELMLMYAQQMVEQERKLNLLEDKQADIETRLAEIETRTVTALPYTTIVGFANRYGIHMPREKACVLGRVATGLCKRYGFEMGRVEDPRFGMVKTYPDGVLSETFAKYYPNIKF